MIKYEINKTIIESIKKRFIEKFLEIIFLKRKISNNKKTIIGIIVAKKLNLTPSPKPIESPEKIINFFLFS